MPNNTSVIMNSFCIIDHIMGSVWSGVHDYYTGGDSGLPGQEVSKKNDLS